MNKSKSTFEAGCDGQFLFLGLETDTIFCIFVYDKIVVLSSTACDSLASRLFKKFFSGGEVMKSPWQFFLIVEGLLFLFAVWQIVTSPMIFLLIFGVINIYLVGRRKVRGNFSSFQLIVGCLAVFFALLYNPPIWIMMGFAIVFIVLKGVEISGVDFAKNAKWRKKEMVMVSSDEPQPHSGEQNRQQLFGNDRIGNHVYEWDDINMVVISGDTLIDLGNTILPKRDNVVVIRKGVGRTRILVPSGIGVMLDHSSLAGQVRFLGAQTQLKNESLKVYSDDYDESPRRVKIVTNTIIGDLEVIRV